MASLPVAQQSLFTVLSQELSRLTRVAAGASPAHSFFFGQGRRVSKTMQIVPLVRFLRTPGGPLTVENQDEWAVDMGKVAALIHALEDHDHEAQQATHKAPRGLLSVTPRSLRQLRAHYYRSLKLRQELKRSSRRRLRAKQPRSLAFEIEY